MQNDYLQQLRQRLSLTREEECFRELAEWFGEHRRPLRLKDLRPILRKYFPGEEELESFVEYLESPEGMGKMRKALRLEAWKRGLAGPPRGGE